MRLLCSHAALRAVCPFFEHVRLPDATAWVINLLNIEPSSNLTSTGAGAHVVRRWWWVGAH